MNKQETHTRQEQRLKFAEAGILFVLILAVAIFVGVRYVARDTETASPVAVAEIAQDAAQVATETAPATEPAAMLAETGTLAADQSETAAASVVADSAAAIESAEPEVVTYAMAENAYHAGDYGRSADLFDRYTNDHPGNAWGYYMLGLAQWKSGDPESAEEAFLAALELKPDHQKSLINYARVLLDLDRAEEASARIETALSLDPASVAAQRVMGRIHAEAGRYDEAVTCYQAVLRENGDDVWALNNLGLLYIEQGAYTQALAPLARAALLDDGIACIQNNLGVALERTGHFGAAATAYASALNADAGYAKAEISLARVEELTEAADLQPVDLAALGASFSVVPESGSETTAAAAAGPEPATPDMEVAAAGSDDLFAGAAADLVDDVDSDQTESEAQALTSSTADDESANDGHRNR